MEPTKKKLDLGYLIVAAVVLLTIITVLVVALVLKNTAEKNEDNTSDIVTDELPQTGGDSTTVEPNFACDEYSIGKVQVVGTTRWSCEETGWAGYSIE